MVLCSLSLFDNFMVTWAFFVASTLFLVLGMSGVVFVKYFVNPSYATWSTKTNPQYPSAEMVREEIITACKGVAAATLCPTASLWLSARGISQAYCGVGEQGWGYLLLSFPVLWVVSDFYEFYYHRLGHMYPLFWKVHKHHHVFYNPSPFSVVADEYVDQFARAAPLLVFPMVAPVNIDLMFCIYAVFFYAYGVYLHLGHELEWPDAHHPVINTSFQHFCHHAKSVVNVPYHTGFFFKLWDNMAGSTWPKQCFCAKCARGRGERTLEQYNKVEKPDYSVLLSPSWWMAPRTKVA